MPYIPKEHREREVDLLRRFINPDKKPELDEVIDALIEHVKRHPNKKGHCNYIISRIVSGGMEPNEGWGYDTISNAHAAFVDAGDEFNRRFMGRYEDGCIERNGDVPEYEYPHFKGDIK